MSSIATDPPMLSQEPAPMAASPTQETGQNTTAAPQQISGEPPIVPFKDRVIGVAKKTRGTLLAKPELKEHGEKILQGQATIHNIDEPRSS
ncbi:hypothetical protein B0H16DRAFT_1565143 [Mycena metata]|uniref:Uncharacterized protein n=1 Tax=Mycena metata TaxID=1033252 RepID=A0AAD7IEG4_9AGAR|nr:hypothetical protein B0H16DRAFT_1565143 [Mycena metata]